MNLQLDFSFFEQMLERKFEKYMQPQTYLGYADVKEFMKISGLSKGDLEQKVLSDKGFQQYVTRLTPGGKRYIKIVPAIEYIDDNLMIKECDL